MKKMNSKSTEFTPSYKSNPYGAQNLSNSKSNTQAIKNITATNPEHKSNNIESLTTIGRVVKKIPQEQQVLDSLASLLVGNEVCASVCLHEGKLFIASNASYPSFAKGYMKSLTNYANNPFIKEYSLLEQEAYDTIFNNAGSIVFKSKISNVSTLKGGADFFAPIFEGLNKITNGGRKPSYEDMSVFVKDLYESLNKAAVLKHGFYDLVWSLLKPIIDLRVVAHAIETQQQIDIDLISAIKEGNIHYIKDTESKHSEMKIIDALLLKESEFFDQKLLDSESRIEVGTSKLACAPCYITIKVLNNEGVEIELTGTHGGNLANWIPPNAITADRVKTQAFIDIWQGELYEERKKTDVNVNRDVALTKTPVLSNWTGWNDLEKIQKSYFKQASRIEKRKELDKFECELKNTKIALEEKNVQSQEFSNVLKTKKTSKLNMDSMRKEQSGINEEITNLNNKLTKIQALINGTDNAALADQKEFNSLVIEIRKIDQVLGNKVRLSVKPQDPKCKDTILEIATKVNNLIITEKMAIFSKKYSSEIERDTVEKNYEKCLEEIKDLKAQCKDYERNIKILKSNGIKIETNIDKAQEDLVLETVKILKNLGYFEDYKVLEDGTYNGKEETWYDQKQNYVDFGAEVNGENSGFEFNYDI